MFLNDTYFQGELALPMLKRTGGPRVGIAKAVQTVNEQSLEYFIGEYEVRGLQAILGPPLAMNFIKGMSESPSQMWQDLYRQIYREDCGIGYSPVANYVYFYTKRDSRSKATTTGEVTGKPDNATRVSDDPKLINAWNNMGREVHYIRMFVRDNWEVYGPYAGLCRCGRDYMDSLMDFCNITRPINPFGI